ncbi:extracelular serine carboxypeptidase-like protein [Mycena polygramma]|nr:extracelular serine carboxypeptidase-like protein [Mycena polygramma]
MVTVRGMLFSVLAASFTLVSGTNFSPTGTSRNRAAAESHLQKRAVAPVVHTFNQVTNHFPNDTFYGPPPPNETFVQRYVVNDTFYKPGGPVFLLDSGETSATGGRFSYLLTGVIGELAQATGGIGLIIEHRYYGQSFPVTNLTTDNLRWLTTDQSIADMAYFAQNVQIPEHPEENFAAPGRPWILYGGSLAGAETAFTVVTYPDIIYGGISSSGTVFAQTTYPQWYYPIQKSAPQDCIRSVENIVNKVDQVIALNDTAATKQMQAVFGLEELEDVRDFGLTIAFPIGNTFTYPNPTWQELNWDPAVNAPDFFEFCSNLTNPNAPDNVTAIDTVLSKYTHGEAWTNLGNYAEYIKRVIVPLCPEGVSLDSNFCFGTHNQTFYADTTDLSGSRSYLYQSCLEAGFFSQGETDRPSLLTRSIDASFSQRWCTWSFPQGQFNSIPNTPALERWNKFGGLSLQADRLAQVDGGIDPWQYACVHSPDGPFEKGGPSVRNDTLLRPYYLIEEGGHHWDENGLLDISKEPAFIQKIHNYEIEFVKSWLADFEEWSANKTKRA